MKVSRIAVAVSVALGSMMSRAGLALGVLSVSIDKDAHTKLPKEAQSFYVEKEGKFVLDLPENFEDVSAVKGALKKERDAVKEAERKAKELVEKYKDVDPEAYRRVMEHFDNAEEAELMKKGAEGIKEIINRRTVKVQEANKKLIEDAQKKIEAAEAKAAKAAQLVLDNHVRAAATKAGVHAHAIEDALIRARGVFSLNDNLEPVQLNGKEVVLNKEGKAPYSVSDWTESMKEAAPHWFPAGNAGGGGGGNKGGNGAGGTTMTRAAFDALGVTEKAAAAVEMRAGKLKIVDGVRP